MYGSGFSPPGTVWQLQEKWVKLPMWFIYFCQNMWCDQAKSVWNWSNSVFILETNCMHHFYSYILQKTPLKLVNWFQRYEQLKDAKNNKKQKTFSALFGSILKSIFPTSDWFCLITSHISNSEHLCVSKWIENSIVMPLYIYIYIYIYKRLIFFAWYMDIYVFWNTNESPNVYEWILYKMVHFSSKMLLHF